MIVSMDLSNDGPRGRNITVEMSDVPMPGDMIVPGLCHDDGPDEETYFVHYRTWQPDHHEGPRVYLRCYPDPPARRML